MEFYTLELDKGGIAMIIDVNELFDELGHLPQVVEIALGGSRATGRNDSKSDYFEYVYITDNIDENTR